MTRPHDRLAAAFLIFFAGLFAGASLAPTALWAQEPSDLLISEYVEGSSFNKAVEIYNGTGGAVDLDGYELAIFFNGSASPGATIELSGTLADGGVYVVADDGADSAILSAADLTPSNNFFNGDDALVLRTSGGAAVDVIGQVGVDPGSQWGSGDASTQDNTIRRSEAACAGDTNPSDAFAPSANYEGLPQDTFGGLGAHAASCDGGDGGDGDAPQLVISEIMYNPSSGEDEWEWVEIYNAGSDAVDLAGYVLDDNNGSAHASATIAGGSVPAGESAVLFNADDVSAADFEAAWGPGINLVAAADWSANALNNSGDQIGLWPSFDDYSGDHETHANVVAGVNYDDSGAWPSDNNSGSIYLTDLSADPSDGAGWALSSPGAATPTFDAYESEAAGGNSGGDAGSPGPGFGGGGTAAAPLLLTEIAVTPTGGEFIEIHNPTGAAVNLSDYYLTDATFAPGGVFYYNIVTGSGAGGGDFSDFHARFPDGASIGPDEYQTVALAGSDAFAAAYGTDPTYELYEDGGGSDGVPEMREAFSGSINGQGGLTNSGEVTALYFWDGASDLVTDVDYAVWGDKAEAVDKTGVSVDGPDGDASPSSYLSDTAISSQDVLALGGHADGQTFTRVDLGEGSETQAGGNGAGGADETSENLSDTWGERAPSPGAAAGAGPELTVVINEVDYDQPGSDDAEFVELYNAGSAAAPLGGLSLEFVNGNGDSVYHTADLPGVSLAAGAHFVICADASATPDCNLEALSSIQNGPDAIGLRGGTELIDAVSYEGAVSSYVEGTATTAADNNDDSFVSLSRLPDGADTDDNDADFTLRCTTPGAANVSDASSCPDPDGPPAPSIAECQSADYTPQTLYDGLSGQALIDQLIADYKPQESNMPPGYGAARDYMYAQIDNQGGSVEGVYSGFTVSGVPQDLGAARGVAQSGGLNAEHTWPQSLGVGSDSPGARTDLHHLFPARAEVNSARSNHPFSEIPDAETDSWYVDATSQSSIPSSNIDAYAEADFDAGRFEPREEREGNAARAMFYVAAIYQGLVSDPDEEAFFTEQLATLLAWNEIDPVDQSEYERTCNVGQVQDGKVNPFVIDPTLAERAFGAGVTVSDVQRAPFVPAAGAPTTVTAQVVASSEPTTVELRYSINGGPQTALSMSAAGGSAYEATIPASAYSDGDRVAYAVYAEASDASDESAEQGFYAGTTPMATLNDRDSDGTLRFLGYAARIDGTATAGAGTFSTTSLDVYLEDDSGGMSLFRGGDTSTTFEVGTRQVVTGTLEQFNGKAQLSPQVIQSEGPVAPIDPAKRTIAELLDAPEEMENRLVRISGAASTTDFPTGGSANVTIEDGTGTLTLRIDGDTGITAADEPEGSYTVTGIFTQFDPSVPLTEGYQIQPRSAADLADLRPPTITIAADPLVLWPPNHRHHTVALGELDLSVSDNSSDDLGPDDVVIASVASDEPENGRGDGNTTGDITVDDCQTVQLRAERQGPGDGRVYTLTLAVADAAGNVGEATYEVHVPKSRKRDATGGPAEYTVGGCEAAPTQSATSDPTAASAESAPGESSDAKAAAQESAPGADMPASYALEGNYPNPFKESTTIRYALPEDGRVRMVVYDLMGREVRVLVDGRKSAGRHVAHFDGRGLSSGMYILRMNAAGGFTAVRRMTLVR